MAKKTKLYPDNSYPDDGGYGHDDFDDLDPMVAASLTKFRKNVHELLTSRPRITPDEFAASGMELLSHVELALGVMYNDQIRDVLGEVMQLEQMLSDKNPDEIYVHAVSYGLVARVDYACLDSIRENREDDLFWMVDCLVEDAMAEDEFRKDALRTKAYINGYDSVVDYYAAEKDDPSGPIRRCGIDQIPWCLMENMPDLDSDDPSISPDGLEAAQEEYGETYLERCLGLPSEYVDALLDSIYEQMHQDGQLSVDGWKGYLCVVGANVQHYGVNGVLELWRSPAHIVGIGSYTPEMLESTYALIAGNVSYLDSIKRLPALYIARTRDEDHNGAFMSTPLQYGSNEFSVPYFQELGAAGDVSSEMSEFARLLGEADQHPEVAVIAAHGLRGRFFLNGGVITTETSAGIDNAEYDHEEIRANDWSDDEVERAIAGDPQLSFDDNDGVDTYPEDDHRLPVREIQGVMDIARVMRPDATGAYSFVMDSCLQGRKDTWGISMLEELADILPHYVSKPGSVHVYGSNESFYAEFDETSGDLSFVAVHEGESRAGGRTKEGRVDIDTYVMNVFYDAAGALHTIQQDALSLPALHRPEEITEENWRG